MQVRLVVCGFVLMLHNAIRFRGVCQKQTRLNKFCETVVVGSPEGAETTSEKPDRVDQEMCESQPQVGGDEGFPDQRQMLVAVSSMAYKHLLQAVRE